MNWAYGVITVPERRYKYLPKTLESLKQAGFRTPTLFVDGHLGSFKEFNLPIVKRYSRIHAFGNWILALLELWIRNPRADRFAIFQDDFITYPNLKEYLDTCELKSDQYWNLLTFPQNEALWDRKTLGWYPSNQFGRGAVALVFNYDCLYKILTSPYIMAKPRNKDNPHRSIDGCLVTSMTKSGVTEMVHYPTLIYHIGDGTSIGNRQHAKPASFQGQSFDAKRLIGS